MTREITACSLAYLLERKFIDYLPLDSRLSIVIAAFDLRYLRVIVVARYLHLLYRCATYLLLLRLRLVLLITEERRGLDTLRAVSTVKHTKVFIRVTLCAELNCVLLEARIRSTAAL